MPSKTLDFRRFRFAPGASTQHRCNVARGADRARDALAVHIEARERQRRAAAGDRWLRGAATVIALKLSPLVFVRPGELRKAEWREIDFDEAIWRIDALKMKGRREPVVALSSHARDLLRSAHGLTERGRGTVGLGETTQDLKVVERLKDLPATSD